ncbi:PREDICTED: protein HEG homolog 1 [Nipponia nippon]|uniref:protein HEG homolog 1 n=1 Tax=Nipponia nippon TaxID=128390 RepID=UPI000510B992|nr:PREDICTED: protein HEG homolog 1 [Nipponia nippon]
MELVTMLDGGRERASLPARHSAVPAASAATQHVSPPAGGGDFTSLGAGPPDSLSAGTATHLPTRSLPPATGSHHRAVGSQERSMRISPGTPVAAEGILRVLAATSTDSAERTLGGHREAWDMAGFDNAMKTVLLPPSAETRPPGFSSSHQPASSIDAEKRTSVSHTDGTYISTTYTRGGERTLLSISNSSTSADSSESSTFFSEISNPSDSLKSSVAQDRTSNISSDDSFVEPSTEPLLVHSSKLLTSASAGSVPNTTLFNTDSELLTTGRSSLSSSAFPASSSSNDRGQVSTSLATTVVRRVPSTAAMAGSSPRGTNKHNVTHHPQNSTTFTSNGSPPLPTAPMEQLGGHIVSVFAPVMVTETTSLRAVTVQGDVDKCLSNPCPALATCNNTRGSYICQCPLGYELEKGKCNLVRTFIGQVPLKLNITHGKYAELLHVEGEILAMLNASLSGLPGYRHSTVKATREANFVHVSVQSTFSLASNVTFYDVVSSVKSYIRACKSPTEVCQFISSLKPLHRVGSLCKQKDPECDKETSECTDFDGVALCQCKSGYFKYNKMDHSCRACEDGYKLENETCVSCPFGLGGFNCGNSYQLITVVIAAAGGGLLLIMGIALIVTCCRKNKNDISKLIFKSGDFQMSPYAEYPKNPRAQEWGRETIEMQENGSTKNLLQMTDVYYSPTGLRNPELERNGLYPPYTGLPGSRHSCIYPGQYNPSFISDETRRRDYF